MNNFDACLSVILLSEGDFVNDPDDPGGPTNLGITIGTLSDYRGKPASVADVKALTHDTVAPIYEKNYWKPCGADVAPAGVDLMIFDMAVNQGVGTAIRAAQATIGAVVDGVMGPHTRDLLTRCDPISTINTIATLREVKYKASKKFPKFGRGWMARLDHTKALALKMAGAA